MIIAVVALMAASCGGSSSGGSSGNDSNEPPVISGNWFRPGADSSWQIQLQGNLDKSIAADIYDVDLFDTPDSEIASLKLSGKKVSCYFSAGSFEDWRPDADRYKASDLGKALDDWPGEKWVDVRSENVREIIKSRLDMAKTKGCDCVDPDNMDGYQNDTGIDLKPEDQLDFNRFVANEAHKRGLGVGLKNDLGQIAELVDYFDFAINEQCHIYDECNLLAPFVSQGKTVLNIEYDEKFISNESERNRLCSNSAGIGLYTLIMPLNLDGSFRMSCDSTTTD